MRNSFYPVHCGSMQDYRKSCFSPENFNVRGSFFFLSSFSFQQTKAKKDSYGCFGYFKRGQQQKNSHMKKSFFGFFLFVKKNYLPLDNSSFSNFPRGNRQFFPFSFQKRGTICKDGQRFSKEIWEIILDQIRFPPFF